MEGKGLERRLTALCGNACCILCSVFHSLWKLLIDIKLPNVSSWEQPIFHPNSMLGPFTLMHESWGQFTICFENGKNFDLFKQQIIKYIIMSNSFFFSFFFYTCTQLSSYTVCIQPCTWSMYTMFAYPWSVICQYAGMLTLPQQSAWGIILQS